MMSLIQIDNLSLIEDNINHIRFEIDSNESFYFRISKESHLLFYRCMIEALKGTANLQVIYDKRKKRKRTHKYKLGEQDWKEIKKITIDGCNRAWRYSEPNPCEAPDIRPRNWDDINSENFLINFYDALALIQTECFMSKYIHSQPIAINDIEMKEFEILHELVRNSFEHFIPSTWIITKEELINRAILCLNKSYSLLFESNNIIFHNSVDSLKTKMLDTRESLLHM